MASFKKASKQQGKLRLALIGPSGSGKTYTALRIARGLGKRIAVIDTERGSASKYAGDVAEFDAMELATFAPSTFVSAIKAADELGYDVLIIDSLSHAWMGKDGALEQVDKAAKRTQSGNSYAAWRDVTPQHNALVDAMLQSKCHVIVTMRVKTEYVLEVDSRGKNVPRKVGLAPIQRDGMEYEFDVVADIDLDHNFMVSKTRCAALDGSVVKKAGEDDVAKTLREWLSTGSPRVDTAPANTDSADAVQVDLATKSVSDGEVVYTLTEHMGLLDRVQNVDQLRTWFSTLQTLDLDGPQKKAAWKAFKDICAGFEVDPAEFTAKKGG